YDDLAIARHLNPPLTTVRQDPVAMGREAVDALKRLASEEVVSRVIEVKSRLVVRASSLKFKSDSSRGGTVTP
ncbi:MAG TPA: substrate-binding domain-containing protein, partial [Limnochordia bacterium]|nr:substrate-binding domain-containing protein [Limnochordia bacterium]